MVILDGEHWWIRLRLGAWHGIGWVASKPTQWSEPLVGKYDKDRKAFYIVGTDEHYETWRAKPLRKIPTIRSKR